MDAWSTFIAFMNNNFGISKDLVLPALIGTVMIAAIFALVLYEAFSRITENKGGVAIVSILVGIASAIYLLYSGVILWIAGFGTVVLVLVFFIFLISLAWVQWSRHSKFVSKERREAFEERKAFHEAIKKKALEALNQFWENENKAALQLWTYLKKIKEVSEKNQESVSNSLSDIYTTADRHIAVCQRWRRYFIKQFGRFSKEVKYTDGVIDSWAAIRDSSSRAIDAIRRGDFDEATDKINEMKGLAKKNIRQTTHGEETTEKEEKNKKKEEKKEKKDIKTILGILGKVKVAPTKEKEKNIKNFRNQLMKAVRDLKNKEKVVEAVIKVCGDNEKKLQNLLKSKLDECETVNKIPVDRLQVIWNTIKDIEENLNNCLKNKK